MVRRVRPDTDRAPGLRDLLVQKYEDMTARPWGARDGRIQMRVDALRAGHPVVLAGWELFRFNLPAVRRGVHTFYRVEPDGRVVEVTARRAPQDPGSIVGWDEVA